MLFYKFCDLFLPVKIKYWNFFNLSNINPVRKLPNKEPKDLNSIMKDNVARELSKISLRSSKVGPTILSEIPYTEKQIIV